MTSRTVIVIPARFGSTRFPGKPLTPILGRPLIQWSHEAAARVPGVRAVYVATDDDRIADVVRGFGGRALMTPADCANGTERVAACLDRLPDDAELVVNFQGDALLTPPAFVADIVAHMAADAECAVATAATRCSPGTYAHLLADAQAGRVGGTTVVLDAEDRALYFSKRILPHIAPGDPRAGMPPVLLHLGLYGYRRAALERYAALPVTMLETVEGLEQLRFLVHGIPIAVRCFDPPAHDLVEVNNPQDVAVVDRILRA
jgi:3-deoxy-manno-octulosonate cytidylyltransferase (CMP-KDO synthetase)